MGRWEPNASDRLIEAAMELFRDDGFDRTTVADIAAKAGLTERTFFRYFADKREVLFKGASELEASIVLAIEKTPAKLGPVDTLITVLAQAGEGMDEHVGHARASVRQEILSSHPELLERELIKLARLASAMAAALRARGVEEPAASIVAEAGIGIFKVGFTRWIAHGGALATHIRDAGTTLREVTRRR